MSKSSTTTKGALLPNPTPGEILLEEFLKPTAQTPCPLPSSGGGS